jgi:hypothetical protein
MDLVPCEARLGGFARRTRLVAQRDRTWEVGVEGVVNERREACC